MESLELRIFVKAAQTKSITKAAEQLGYVQSNVTAHIKKLELELGTPLFIRSNKGITLTRDGEQLLYRAEQIIIQLDELEHEFNKRTASLVIGATQTIEGFLLPMCIAEYRKQYPEVSISVRIQDQDHLEELLQQGQLDCLLTNSESAIFGKLLFQQEEKLILIAPLSCSCIEDIWEYPLLVNTLPSCPYRKALLRWKSALHKNDTEIIEYDSLNGLLNMAALGGFTLLPQHVLSESLPLQQFYVRELQGTRIKLWIPEHGAANMWNPFVMLLEKQLKRHTSVCL